jgi:zinc transporter
LAIAETPYGSDKEGLVFGYGFAPGQPGRALESQEAAEWFGSSPPSAGSFAWIHFSVANAGSERWLREHLALPEGFYPSLHEEGASSRIELDGDWLLAVINDVLFDFAFDANQVAALSICANRRLLVSARCKPLRSVERLRTSVRQGESFRSPAELLAHLMRDQAEVLVQIVRDSTARVNAVEDRLLASRVGSSRKELGVLRRVLVRLQRLLAPEPAALFRLLSRPPAWLSGEDVLNLRDSAEEFQAAVADSGALVDRVKLLQEELAALINEQNNRSLFVLTIVTVVALPINIIAGLFGMNVGGIPLAEHPGGFWVVVTLVAAFTGGAGYLAFRKWVK